MATVDETARRLGEIQPLTISRDALLSHYTRFGIGGPASILVEAPDAASFVAALQIARSSGLNYVVIGGGTNLIVSDDGFCGVVLKLTARSITIDGSIFKNFLLAELPGGVAAQVPKTSIIEGKVPSAWFLEQVGAKGMRQGGIHVADYHANLIYNVGDGTARELRTVIGELKRRVR